MQRVETTTEAAGETDRSGPEIANWASAYAAYQIAESESAAAWRTYRAAAQEIARTLSGSDATDWPRIAQDPHVAPLDAARWAADERLAAAALALITAPTPDFRAWAAKFQVVREHCDDVLNPMDLRDRARRKRGKQFPGTRLAADLHHYALAAHVGALDAQFLPNIAKLTRRFMKKVLVSSRDGRPLDIKRADHLAEAAASDDIVTAGLLQLYRDAVRLAANPPAHGAADGTRPTAVRARWDAAREAFFAARDASRALEEDAVESQEAWLAMVRTLLTYVQTPPPDLAALEQMMRDALEFDVLPGFASTADDPVAVQALLDDDEAGINYLAMVYQHVRRMIGDVGPIHACRRALPTKRAETDAEFKARVRGAAELPVACPVEKLAREIQSLLLAEQAADARGDGEAAADIADTRDTLENRAVGLQARSPEGAALQLALATARGEMIRGCVHQEDRDRYHDDFEQLMRSGLNVLGDALPNDLWTAYVGGERAAHLQPVDEDVIAGAAGHERGPQVVAS